MSVEQHLVALARIRDQPERAARAQLHVRYLHPPPDAADHDPFFAPVELECLAPREGQRHVGRSSGDGTRLRSPSPERLCDTGIMAAKPFGLELLMQAPCCTALRARPPRIHFQ